MNQLKELQYIHNIITAVFITSIIGLFFEVTRLACAIFIVLVWLSNIVWGGCIMTQAEDRLRKVFDKAKRRTPFLNTFIQKILQLNISIPKKSIDILMAACAVLALLQVVSAATPYLLTQGDRLTIDINETNYILVDVEHVSEKGALILFNGQEAGMAKEDEWIKYDDGSQIFINELLVSDSSLDMVEIYINALTSFTKPGKTVVEKEIIEPTIIVETNDAVEPELTTKDIPELEEKGFFSKLIDFLIFWN